MQKPVVETNFIVFFLLIIRFCALIIICCNISSLANLQALKFHYVTCFFWK